MTVPIQKVLPSFRNINPQLQKVDKFRNEALTRRTRDETGPRMRW